jgi:hypothetical protein
VSAEAVESTKAIVDGCELSALSGSPVRRPARLWRAESRSLPGASPWLNRKGGQRATRRLLLWLGKRRELDVLGPRRSKHHVAGSDDDDFTMVRIASGRGTERRSNDQAYAVGIIEVGNGLQDVTVEDDDGPLLQLFGGDCTPEGEPVRLLLVRHMPKA